MAALEIGNVDGEVTCRARYTMLPYGNNPTGGCKGEGILHYVTFPFVITHRFVLLYKEQSILNSTPLLSNSRLLYHRLFEFKGLWIVFGRNHKTQSRSQPSQSLCHPVRKRDSVGLLCYSYRQYTSIQLELSSRHRFPCPLYKHPGRRLHYSPRPAH